MWEKANSGRIEASAASRIGPGGPPAPPEPVGIGARTSSRFEPSRPPDNGARILAGGRPTEAPRTRRFVPNIARLQHEGFSENDARACFMVLARFAMGFALAEQAGRGATDASTADFELGLQAMIDGLDRRRSRG